MKAVVNAKPRNAGERSSSAKDRPIAARLAGMGLRWVSSRRAAVRTSTAAPSAPSSAKSARQPIHWAKYAPIAGEIDGARLIAIMIVARRVGAAMLIFAGLYFMGSFATSLAQEPGKKEQAKTPYVRPKWNDKQIA